MFTNGLWPRSELPHLEEVTEGLLTRQASQRRSESLQRRLFALLTELSELPQLYSAAPGLRVLPTRQL